MKVLLKVDGVENRVVESVKLKSNVGSNYKTCSAKKIAVGQVDVNKSDGEIEMNQQFKLINMFDEVI